MQEKTVQARRKTLDKYRKGEMTLHIPFPQGSIMFVKDCPVCKRAGADMFLISEIYSSSSRPLCSLRRFNDEIVYCEYCSRDEDYCDCLRCEDCGAIYPYECRCGFDDICVYGPDPEDEHLI